MASDLPRESSPALQHLQLLTWLHAQLSRLHESVGETYHDLSLKQKALVATAAVVVTFACISTFSMIAGNFGVSQTAISGIAGDRYPVYTDPEHLFPVSAPPSPLYEAVAPDNIDAILNTAIARLAYLMDAPSLAPEYERELLPLFLEHGLLPMIEGYRAADNYLADMRIHELETYVLPVFDPANLDTLTQNDYLRARQRMEPLIRVFLDNSGYGSLQDKAPGLDPVILSRAWAYLDEKAYGGLLESAAGHYRHRADMPSQQVGFALEILNGALRSFIQDPLLINEGMVPELVMLRDAAAISIHNAPLEGYQVKAVADETGIRISASTLEGIVLRLPAIPYDLCVEAFPPGLPMGNDCISPIVSR